MRRISGRHALVPLCAVALLLAGCSGGDDDPLADAPDEVATVAGDLADALAADAVVEEGEEPALSGLAYVGMEAGSAAEEYAEVVARMSGVEPTVEVASVETGDTTATVTLDWAWPVLEGADPWTYQSSVELREDGGDWAVAWHRSVVEPGLNDRQVIAARTIPSDRGDITGAGGEVLVTERPVVRVGIDRVRVGARRAGASAAALAELVGIDVAPYVEAVEAAGDRAFVEAITFRKAELPAEVVTAADDIEGALLLADDLALAPTREFAAPILGRVGPVTAEMIEESPEEYEIGDVAGVSGLQARYDDQLRGTPGVVVEATSPDRTGGRDLFRVEPTAGEELALTLDARLQTTAEQLLAGIGPGSALVAVRPSDGAILAAANGPGTGGLNLATYGQFAPGSTFKIVSSLALLRAGLTPDSAMSCPASLTVDGKRFGNYSDYPASALGEIPFRTAVAESCNTAFISARDELGERDLVDAAASLGLGVDHDLGFPAFLGSVEPPASETEKAADLIGQGRILASPMAMAAVIASVQAGELVVPRLVEGVEVDDHDHEPLTGEEAAALQQMLREVVASGSGQELADLPGPPALAKTGTAEFEGDSGLQTHAWMVGAHGDLAVAVFVEVGASGSQTAGPILEEFLRAAP
ncbi:MAG TPA: penicillin-binding transpeptidase domain-containing protein [Nocardioides sp.]|nr:penicillin-binding transpeptidase domain-containing protein [Nocardioides sp.]